MRQTLRDIDLDTDIVAVDAEDRGEAHSSQRISFVLTTLTI